MAATGLRRELEQASVNLNHHLKEQQHHADEVTRWQEIVSKLEETIACLESPASAVRKKAPSPAVARESGAPRIRWAKQWPIVLGELSAKNVVPSKRMLMDIIQSRYKISEQNANAAVNGAIQRGDLLLRQDHCYLPTLEQAQAGAA
jgi:hypothetical protein